MKPEHWLHCSQRDHGERWTAERIAPIRWSSKEPPVPRLCVAPTVATCFAAAVFLRGPVHVYRTAKPRRAVAPRGVWDECITRERWLIPPVEMIRIQTIDAETARLAQDEIVAYHTLTKGNSDLFLRAAQYAIVAEVLGCDEQERRWVRRVLQVTQIKDPRDYITERLLSRLQKIAESV